MEDAKLIDALHVAGQQPRLQDTQCYESRGTGEAGRVVCPVQIIVDSFRHADPLHRVAVGAGVLGDSMDCVHRIIAADHEQIANVMLLELRQDRFEMFLFQL